MTRVWLFFLDNKPESTWAAISCFIIASFASRQICGGFYLQKQSHCPSFAVFFNGRKSRQYLSLIKSQLMKLVALSCRLSPPHSLFINLCSVCSLPLASAILCSSQVTALKFYTLLLILFRLFLILIRLPPRNFTETVAQKLRLVPVPFFSLSTRCKHSAATELLLHLVRNQLQFVCLLSTATINSVLQHLQGSQQPFDLVSPKTTFLPHTGSNISTQLSHSQTLPSVLVSINGSGYGSWKCRLRPKDETTPHGSD